MSLVEFAFILGVIVTTAALCWAAVSDIRGFVIPNRASLLICAGYVLTATGMPPETEVGGIAVAAAVFLLGLALFAGGLVGGGDVKLAAATALWAGPDRIGQFALVTAVAGGILGLALLTPLGATLSRPAGSDPAAPRHKQAMPFGVALAVGGLAILFHPSQAIPG